ncbi:MAG TPA: lamin tail domain-containing protein, partial [Chitinophagaceae bacterium]|nr:lamin tail domain-containing protein [Chitinophagaceae bacterium]
MKKILLSITVINFVLVSRSQVLFNEVYTDPAAGNSEFFELYNTGTSSTPLSMDDYTIVTYFETPKTKGFYVMDLPNLTIAPKGYFVGASSIPFSYQGVTNSTAADFSWNSSAFTSNNGYVREWLYNPGGDLTDGNPNYDTVALPSNFNDFFFRRTGSGPTYSIFLFNKGVLIDALIFGTGGAASVLPAIISSPPLFVDMSGSSPDFTINFGSYASAPLETVGQDAGTDNGYYRSADGLCGGWLKSDAQAQHTPKQTNGYVDAYSGTISVTAIIQRGTVATGSKIIYDVISAPSTSFPVTMDVYKDDGTLLLKLDAGDEYVASNTEDTVTDGPFTTWFTPYDANMLVVVKSNIGCIDKILFSPNISILPVTLVYFQGSRENNQATLHWSVAQNEMSSRFEVERSYDGKNFSTIAIVTATTKTGSENYSFSESVAADRIYYRLKMYDNAQSATYSKIIAFQNPTTSSALKVLNNPVRDQLTLSFNSLNGKQTEVRVYDVSGRLQMTQKVTVYQGSNLLSLPLRSS